MNKIDKIKRLADVLSMTRPEANAIQNLLAEYTPDDFRSLSKLKDSPLSLESMCGWVRCAVENETDQPGDSEELWQTLHRIIVRVENISNASDLDVVLKYHHGAVMERLRREPGTASATVCFLGDIYKNHAEMFGCYVDRDEFTNEEWSRLCEQNLVEPAQGEQLASSTFTWTDELSGDLDETGLDLRVKLVQSISDLEADAFSIGTCLVMQLTSDKNHEKRELSYELQPFFTNAYFYHKNRLQDVLESRNRIHQLVWILLDRFTNDPEKGLFRPYSQVNPELVKILVDYLVMDLKHHLPIFVTMYRQAEYEHWSPYGMTYDGREKSGGWSGGGETERKLNEHPLAEKLLCPALDKIKGKAEKDGTISQFADILETDFLNLKREIGPFNPSILRRSAVPVWVDLLHDEAIDADRGFRVLRELISQKDGIPSISEKTWCALFHACKDDGFISRCGNQIQEIGTDAINRSLWHVPGHFCFRVIVFLAKAGYVGAIELVRSVIHNPRAYRYDLHDLYILHRLEHELGLDHELTKEAIHQYLESEGWQKQSEPSRNEQTLVKFFAYKTDLVETVVQLLASHPNLVPGVFRTRSDTDSDGAIRGIIEVLAGRRPDEIFDNRSFILHVLHNYWKSIEDAVAKTSNVPNPEFFANYVKLCGLLSDDPDPSREETDAGWKNGVRSELAFTIRPLCCLEEYFTEAWVLTKKLLLDPNPCVREYALHAFREILKRRKWDTEVRGKSEGLLWKLLDQCPKKDSYRKFLFNCFNAVRDLATDQACTVVDFFSDVDDVEYLLVFYAIFRNTPRLSEEWGEFDPEPFIKRMHSKLQGDTQSATRLYNVYAETIRDDHGTYDILWPWVCEFCESQDVDDGVIRTGFGIAQDLLSAEKESDKRRGLEASRYFVEKQCLLAHNSVSKVHRYYSKMLVMVYAVDKHSFYEQLALVVDSTLQYPGGLLMSDELRILENETDADFAPMIRSILDQLI